MQTVRLKLRTDEIDFVVKPKGKNFYSIISAKSATTGKQLEPWLLPVYEGEPGPTLNPIQQMIKDKIDACNN